MTGLDKCDLIDKKGFLNNYTIINQEAMDILYNNLKNSQLELNYGSQNE